MYRRAGTRVAEDCVKRAAASVARQTRQNEQGASWRCLILRSGVASQAKSGWAALSRDSLNGLPPCNKDALCSHSTKIKELAETLQRLRLRQ